MSRSFWGANAVLLVFAVVAIAAGSAVGAYAIWLRFSASAAPDASQLARTRQLALALASPSSSKGSSARPTPRPGDPVAVVRIPALGRTWQYPVYEGTQDAELNKGLAHYSGTAEPGAVGNFAIAGHRSSVSGFEPFADLPDLVRPGNEIVVTAAGGVFKYTVTATESVPPTAVQVLAADQGRGVNPNQRLITLTTCTPRYGHSGRYIVFGRLEH